jgi:hypothetical protein
LARPSAPAVQRLCVGSAPAARCAVLDRFTAYVSVSSSVVRHQQGSRQSVSVTAAQPHVNMQQPRERLNVYSCTRLNFARSNNGSALWSPSRLSIRTPHPPRVIVHRPSSKFHGRRVIKPLPPPRTPSRGSATQRLLQRCHKIGRRETMGLATRKSDSPGSSHQAREISLETKTQPKEVSVASQSSSLARARNP